MTRNCAVNVYCPWDVINQNRQSLFNAVWDGDEKKLQDEMTKLLRKTISYYDYREDFYHAFLAGIFAGAGYNVESNKEYGEGRSDVLIQDSDNGRVAVFEVKYSNERTDLQKDCKKAVLQITDKQYALQFIDDNESVMCFGISFYKKQCMVRKTEL